ncbi:MAG: hypothetical protein AAF891_11100 [Pseudomonadota bacterium]
MAQRPVTSLAALLLQNEAEDAFYSLADLILASKLGDQANTRSITWDCEDLVFIDFDDVRIALQYASQLEGLPCRISLALGLRPDTTNAPDVDCNRLARLLVQRLSTMFAVKLVLWQETTCAPTADVMDDFQEELSAIHDYLDCYVANVSTDPEGVHAPLNSQQREPTSKVKDATENALFDFYADTVLERTPIAAEEQELSAPMHASMYMMACTLLFLVPAIGTGLFSYLALRDGLDTSPLIT